MSHTHTLHTLYFWRICVVTSLRSEAEFNTCRIMWLLRVYQVWGAVHVFWIRYAIVALSHTHENYACGSCTAFDLMQDVARLQLGRWNSGRLLLQGYRVTHEQSGATLEGMREESGGCIATEAQVNHQCDQDRTAKPTQLNLLAHTGAPHTCSQYDNHLTS